MRRGGADLSALPVQRVGLRRGFCLNEIDAGAAGIFSAGRPLSYQLVAGIVVDQALRLGETVGLELPE
jgi:hypothetical protein